MNRGQTIPPWMSFSDCSGREHLQMSSTFLLDVMLSLSHN